MILARGLAKCFHKRGLQEHSGLNGVGAKHVCAQPGETMRMRPIVVENWPGWGDWT